MLGTLPLILSPDRSFQCDESIFLYIKKTTDNNCYLIIIIIYHCYIHVNKARRNCGFSFFLFFIIACQCVCVWNKQRTSLGAELAEQCHPSSDPVLSRHVRVECHGDDIVGWVAGGGQRASPLAGLVDGHYVTHPLGNVLSLDRPQPHLTDREEQGDRDESNGLNM